MGRYENTFEHPFLGIVNAFRSAVLFTVFLVSTAMLANAQIAVERIENPVNFIKDENNFDRNQGFINEFNLLSIGNIEKGGLSFSIRRAPTVPFHRFQFGDQPLAEPHPNGDIWTFSTMSGKVAGSFYSELFPTPPSSAPLVIIDNMTLRYGFESVRVSNVHQSSTPEVSAAFLAEYGEGTVWPSVGENTIFSPGSSFAYFRNSPEFDEFGDLGNILGPVSIYHEDGRKINFDNEYGTISSIDYPNGFSHRYHYVDLAPNLENTLYEDYHFVRLQSITSNAGYMLHFTYKDNPEATELQPSSVLPDPDWSVLTKVTAINTSVYQCGEISYICSDSQGENWPYVILNNLRSPVHPKYLNSFPFPFIDYSQFRGWQYLDSFEDRLGNKTEFDYYNERPVWADDHDLDFVYLSAISTPEDVNVDDISYNWSVNQQGLRTRNAIIHGQNWDYTISETSTSYSGGVTERKGFGSVSGPEGYLSSWNSEFQGTATGIFDIIDISTNGRTTSCDPSCSVRYGITGVDSDEELVRKIVTSPGGGKQTYTFLGGSRGLLSEGRLTPEPESSLEDIAQDYSYRDQNHLNSESKYNDWRNYNKPLSYSDPLSNAFNYSHDPSHGGLTDKLRPASGSGSYASLRPETRVTYKDIGNGITLPDQIFTCATSASCAGTADETITTFTYYPITGQVETETVSSGDGSKSRTTRYTYTPLGDIATIDGPLPGAGDTTYRFYDDIRRLVAEVAPDPDGAGPELHQVVRYTYNADGNITVEDRGRVATPSNWNALTLSSQTKFYYDPYGRKIRDEIIKIGGAENGQIGALTQYNYDGRGRIKCVANRMNPDAFNTPPSDACALGPEGAFGPDRITKTEYTVHSEIEKVIRALGTPLQQDYQTYTYYPDGMMESVTDANGNKTTYEYDGFNRLSKTRFPSKTTPGASSTTDYEAYTYDAAGNRKTLRKRDGRTIAYDYDNLNRLTRKDVPAPDRDVYYDYDLRDLEISALFDSASGPGLRHSYDALGQLTAATSDLTSTTLSYLYDAAGNRTRVTHPDGNYFTYDVDALSRPTYIRENGSAWVNQFTYDAAARLNAIGHKDRLNWSVGYDDLSRVGSLAIDAVAGSSADVTETFNFNPVSQLTLVSRTNSAYSQLPSGAQDGAYVANGLNQYTSVDGAAFSYDGNGNLTSDGNTTYAYDVENRLVSMTPSGGGAVALKYDPYGRLYEVAGAATTRFVYDGDAMIQELDGANALLRRYVHGNGVDEPLVWYEGAGLADANRRHFARDRQGSIVAVAESATTAPNINAYTPFGVPDTSNTGRFSYTGQMVVPEIDLLYYKARIYSPQLGRFLQTDPIGYEDQQNLYAYVANDPMNLLDPNGEAGQLVAGGAAGCALSGPACPVGAAFGVAVAAAATVVAVIVANEISDEVGRGGDGRELSPNDNGGPTSDPEPGPPAPFIPDFTEHGAERSDERGIPGVVAGDAVTNPDNFSTPGDNDTTVFFSPSNNVTTVISNETGAVVTIRNGAPNGPEGQRIREQMSERDDTQSDGFN